MNLLRLINRKIKGRFILRDNNGKVILHQEIWEVMADFNLNREEAILFIKEVRDQLSTREDFLNPIINWSDFFHGSWEDDLPDVPDIYLKKF